MDHCKAELIDDAAEETDSPGKHRELYIKGYAVNSINKYNKDQMRVVFFTDQAIYHIKYYFPQKRVKHWKRFNIRDVAYVHHGLFDRESSVYGLKVVLSSPKTELGFVDKLYRMLDTEEGDAHSVCREMAQICDCLLRNAKGSEGLGLVNQHTVTRPGLATGIQRVVSDTIHGRIVVG